ncbi:MAG: hypothetical protein Q8940_07275 [Bacteroidota bacterium]|nr:hypothetical protein [Bacteroidota bacterium]
MSLSLGTGNNENSTDMKGVYVSQSSIVNASDVSGRPVFDNTFDLALELEITTNFDWNKKFTLKGNFKRDPQNQKVVIDWGGAFVIRNIFQMLGFFDSLNDEEKKEKMNLFQLGKIPIDFLQRLKGQKIYTLSYVYGWDAEKGKAKYTTWNQVGLDRSKLLAEFKKSLMKGFPKNYDPDSLENRVADFDTEAENYNPSKEQVSSSVDDDDDLPF